MSNPFETQRKYMSLITATVVLPVLRDTPSLGDTQATLQEVLGEHSHWVREVSAKVVTGREKNIPKSRLIGLTTARDVSRFGGGKDKQGGYLDIPAAHFRTPIREADTPDSEGFWMSGDGLPVVLGENGEEAEALARAIDAYRSTFPLGEMPDHITGPWRLLVTMDELREHAPKVVAQ